MNHVFNAGYSFNPEEIRDELLLSTKNKVMAAYITDIQNEHETSNNMNVIWLRSMARVPRKQSGEVVHPLEVERMRTNFLRGAHLAIHGLCMTEAEPVLPMLTPNVIRDSHAQLDESMKRRPDVSFPIIDMWQPETIDMAEKAYAKLMSHHVALDDWAERATQGDMYRASSGEQSFKQGYSLMLDFAGAVVNAEARSSFRKFMRSCVFDDPAELRTWAELETLFIPEAK